MENGMIHVDDLREMDRIAASMEEDYTLEDLIQAVECKEDFTRPHSFIINRKDEMALMRINRKLTCENCKYEIWSEDWDKKWKYCPVCGLPIVRWEEED